MMASDPACVVGDWNNGFYEGYVAPRGEDSFFFFIFFFQGEYHRIEAIWLEKKNFQK